MPYHVAMTQIANGLAEKVDAEDLSEIFRSYWQRCADIARSLEGTVAQYQGDGVLVYFGYPRAHEDDAERAVRAGLDVISATADMQGNAGGVVPSPSALVTVPAAVRPVSTAAAHSAPRARPTLVAIVDTDMTDPPGGRNGLF